MKGIVLRDATGIVPVIFLSFRLAGKSNIQYHLPRE
jgi:hypothetical protein